jgi:hypothetical protein
MQRDGGSEEMLHTFLPLVLDDCEWLTPHSGCFITGEIGPGTHWIGGWADMDAVVKIMSYIYQKLSYDSLVIKTIT